MPTENGNGWEVWGKHIIFEIGRLNDSNEEITKKIEALKDDNNKAHSIMDKNVVASSIEIRDKISDLNVNLSTDIGKLNVKSGIWGLIGGMIPVCIIIVLKIFLGV